MSRKSWGVSCKTDGKRRPRDWACGCRVSYTHTHHATHTTPHTNTHTTHTLHHTTHIGSHITPRTQINTNTPRTLHPAFLVVWEQVLSTSLGDCPLQSLPLPRRCLFSGVGVLCISGGRAASLAWPTGILGPAWEPTLMGWLLVPQTQTLAWGSWPPWDSTAHPLSPSPPHSSAQRSGSAMHYIPHVQ